MVDAWRPHPDDPRRRCDRLSTDTPFHHWDGPGREDAGRHPRDLHPHPVPAFLTYVIVRLLEARAESADR